jgi:long-chain fatty acid transport protein
MFAFSRRCLQVSVAASALLVTAGDAVAGGFAVREQSTTSQGASFAGNAAGGDLSSMFWNPAALGVMGGGLHTQSGVAILFPENEMTAKDGTTLLGLVPNTVDSTDSGRTAFVPSSYVGYRLSPDFAIGVSLNAPFGLGSEPDADNWIGATHGRSAKLTTYNLTPTAAYRLAPGIFLGAGIQLEYASLLFKFSGPPSPATGQNAGLDIEDDIGIGFTAGLLWQPNPGTSIGVGFRSSITHEFEGNSFLVGTPAVGGPIEAELETPETVTLSLRQALAPNWRLLATVEWSNWSRFDSVPILCTGPSIGIPPAGCAAGDTLAVLDANWHDGWFYALGFEHDYKPGLTLRAGIAYEQSPVQNPEERLPQVPDSDRVWLSAGLSYQIMQNVTLDFAYTHIFLEDAEIDRLNLVQPPALRLVADREASVDIISLGYRIRWGGEAPLK